MKAKKRLVVLVLLLGLTFAMPINNDYTVSAATTQKSTTYKITYKLNGGINNKKNPVSYKKNKTIKLVNPTKKGYVFKGWYSNSKLTKKVTSVKNKNITLYAKWSPISYTVKYNGNGGKGKISNLTNRKYNKSFKLSKNKYSKKGYIFVGWNTRKDGKGKVYKAGASVKNLTSKNKGSVTLYAMWKNKFKISYVLNGGVNNKSNPSTYKINTGVVLKNPTRSGYKFLGWYRDAKFKNKVTSIKKGYNKDIKLYAKWVKIEIPKTEKALALAKKYLTYEYGYSYDMLKQIIKSQGYTESEAKYAVDKCGANWDLQAVKELNSLKNSNYSKNDLKNILVSDKFTTANINYAFSKVVINYNEAAYNNIKSYLNYNPVNKEEATKILRNRLFLDSEVNYAINKINFNDVAKNKAQKLVNDKTFIYSKETLKNKLINDFKFQESEAEYAVNNCNANWNEYALRATNLLNKSYLSEVKLRENLKNSFKFTNDEIEYAIKTANIDFNEVAVNSGKERIKYSNLSYASFGNVLKVNYGFTDENVAYAESVLKDTINWNEVAINFILKRLESTNNGYTTNYASLLKMKEYLTIAKFSEDEIEYALNNCNVDWDNEAIRGVEYMIKASNLSYQGLIDSLTSDKFSEEQISKAMEITKDVNWNERASNLAKRLIENDLEDDGIVNYYTYDKLKQEIMVSHKFSEEQAIYGVENCGYTWESEGN